MYFPRFLELVNNLTEDWFEQGLGMPFNEFHLVHGYGVPVVNTKVDFLKACRLGERLSLELSIESLGGSSTVLAIRGRVDGEERLRLRRKVMIVSLEARRAVAIPQELRERMERYLIRPDRISPCPVAVAATFLGSSGG